ncbi:hypothetical protein C9I98_24465 [Photobacterium sanctipauli]|uniref:Uncharacterized protein n=1 Tax=Photobacterium sanctipauli TaxID=1342794 RepID=A0A2T3NBT4_9GAMM|nr:hypothetical protein [Photobacterium sanctipauli]PSW11404.1 hypothetical protein C9I98_24465 [Photobacterium sanctipauli]
MATISYSFRYKHIEVEQLSHQVRTLQHSIQADSQLAKLPTTELLQVINELPEQKQLLKDGLLRSHQKQIITLYEQRISAILTHRENSYPDYYAIEKQLTEAQAFYPDSHTLMAIADTITHSWQSTTTMLEDQLNTLLEKQVYLSEEILFILTELGKVKKEHRFSPSQKANELYFDAFQSAMDRRDLNELQSLIEIGELVFAGNKQHHALLNSGIQLSSAIQKLSHYQAKHQAGESIEFPYQAAALFYKKQFQQLESALSQADKVSQLDALHDEIKQLPLSIPNNFAPLNQIRLLTAIQYLKVSDQMLEGKKRLEASDAMKKANSIFAQLEESNLLAQ